MELTPKQVKLRMSNWCKKKIVPIDITIFYSNNPANQIRINEGATIWLSSCDKDYMFDLGKVGFVSLRPKTITFGYLIKDHLHIHVKQ